MSTGDRRTPRDAWKALCWAASLGVFGVGSGFALFATLNHANDEPYKFAVALIVAAAVSFGGECLRDFVRRGHAFEEGPEPVALRAISTFLVVFVLEVFIESWADAAKVPRTLMQELAHLVLGDKAGESTSFVLNAILLVVSVVWLGLGALLALILAWLTLNESPDRTRPPSPPSETRPGFVGLSVWTGTLAGGLLMPVVMLGSVLLIRFVRAVWLILTDHAAWYASVRTLHDSGPLIALLTAPGIALSEFLLRPPWQVIVSYVVLAAPLVWGIWQKRYGFLLICAAVLWVVLLPAIAYDVVPLLRLVGATALLWLIPGAALGVALPYLREPRPRYWSMLAAASGVVLAGFAYQQAAGSEYVAAGLAFVLALILVFLTLRPELSLLLSLVIGLAIYAAALIPATVAGVFNEFVFLGARPVVGDAGVTSSDLRALARAEDIDEAIRRYPALSRALPVQLGPALARIRSLPELTYQGRGPEIDRLLAVLGQEPATLPADAFKEVQSAGTWPDHRPGEILRNDDAEYRARVTRGPLTGAGVAWWARQDWVKRATSALEAAKVRWLAQADAESIRGVVKSADLSAARLNASMGGAIGFTVTLALLVAWRIKDGPPRDLPDG
jgi:hypothetical protein